MSGHQQFFNCRYPIVEAMMNQGSTLELALAVSEAGAFPSIYPFRVKDASLCTDDYDYMHDQLSEFVRSAGHSQLIVGIGSLMLSNATILKIIRELKISHVEIFSSSATSGQVEDIDIVYSRPDLIAGLKMLKRQSRLMTRVYEPGQNDVLKYFDIVCVKGQESGGKTGTYSVAELFRQQHQLGYSVVPYGGVGTPEQVQDYVTQGAVAVGIGTLFAATVESPLSLQLKQKIVNSTAKDLITLADTNQNALVLNRHAVEKSQDWNRIGQLDAGINGDATQGLVYMGHAIDHVDRIRTVKETVDYLVSELNLK